MTKEEMKKATDDMLRTIVNDQNVARCFAYLKARWRDEQEYEDIHDYAEPMRRALPSFIIMCRASARPFRFYFQVQDDPQIFLLKETPRHTLQIVEAQK